MQVPYQIHDLQFFPFHSVGCLLTFVAFAFSAVSSLTQGNEDIFLFPSKSFIVLGISFGFMFHLELIFVYPVTSTTKGPSTDWVSPTCFPEDNLLYSKCPDSNVNHI